MILLRSYFAAESLAPLWVPKTSWKSVLSAASTIGVSIYLSSSIWAWYQVLYDMSSMRRMKCEGKRGQDSFFHFTFKIWKQKTEQETRSKQSQKLAWYFFNSHSILIQDRNFIKLVQERRRKCHMRLSFGKGRWHLCFIHYGNSECKLSNPKGFISQLTR